MGFKECPSKLPALNASWWSPSNCAALACFAARGGCPTSSWKEATAPEVAQSATLTGGPLVLVNAGANKGYAVGEFVQRFGEASFTVHDWHTNLTDIKKNMMLSCGYCGACREPNPRSHRPLPPQGIHAHAVELMPANALVLKLMFERMHIPGTVHEMALSNYSGEAWRPAFFRTGGEDQGAQASKGPWSSKTEAMALDDWTARHAVRHIHMLSLDAEGWDMRILRGAHALLEAKRIGVLEFEYAPRRWVTAEGGWVPLDADKTRGAPHPAMLTAAQELSRTIGWLGRLGYRCYFQGRDAAAPVLTATRRGIEACRNDIATLGQANLLCAHAPDVHARLRTLRVPADVDAPRSGGKGASSEFQLRRSR